MLTQEQLRICNELVDLYKAQLPLVEPTEARDARTWSLADVELYSQRAGRIARLQEQLIASMTSTPLMLKGSRVVPSGSWQDR